MSVAYNLALSMSDNLAFNPAERPAIDGGHISNNWEDLNRNWENINSNWEDLA